MSQYALFYGSLRQNSRRGHNFNRFAGQTYIRDVWLEGWDMVSLAGGSYPAICKGAGKVKFELHTVVKDSFADIRALELGAGYREEVVTLDDGTKATLFHIAPERLAGRPRVESGDWD